MSRPDYVIVGAGTAGPVIAARLSEDPAVEVVLRRPARRTPTRPAALRGAFFALHGSEADWQYETAKQPGIGGRTITHPQGKVVGGSCALNVGAWLRGALGDRAHRRHHGTREHRVHRAHRGRNDLLG